MGCSRHRPGFSFQIPLVAILILNFRISVFHNGEARVQPVNGQDAMSPDQPVSDQTLSVSEVLDVFKELLFIISTSTHLFVECFQDLSLNCLHYLSRSVEICIAPYSSNCPATQIVTLLFLDANRSCSLRGKMPRTVSRPEKVQCLGHQKQLFTERPSSLRKTWGAEARQDHPEIVRQLWRFHNLGYEA